MLGRNISFGLCKQVEFGIQRLIKNIGSRRIFISKISLLVSLLILLRCSPIDYPNTHTVFTEVVSYSNNSCQEQESKNSTENDFSKGEFYYISTNEGIPAIYSMKVEGKDANRITLKNLTVGDTAALSQYHNKIIFEACINGDNQGKCENERYGIYYYDLLTNHVTNATNVNGNNQNPNWCGLDKIIFFSKFTDSNDLYISRITDSEFIRINTGVVDTNYVSTCSPDGNWIATECKDSDGDNPRICVFSTYDGKAVFITDGFSFSWSPNNLSQANKLGYVCTMNQSGICLFDVEKLNVNFLTEAQETITTLSWSHDGKWLGYISEDESTIYKLCADTENINRPIELLTSRSKISWFSWTPDDLGILFISDGDLYIANTDGTTIQLIETNIIQVIGWLP